MRGFSPVVGDILRQLFIELGPTYRLNVLWDFGILTCDPAIIKVSISTSDLVFDFSCNVTLHYETVLATDFQNYEKGGRAANAGRSE